MWDVYHKIFAGEVYERNYDEAGAHGYIENTYMN